jgi:hypothetical protein
VKGWPKFSVKIHIFAITDSHIKLKFLTPKFPQQKSGRFTVHHHSTHLLSLHHNTSSFLPFSAPPPNPNSNSMHEQFLLNYSRWWTKMCLRRTVRKNKATSSRVVGAVWGRSIRALPSSSFCDVTSGAVPCSQFDLQRTTEHTSDKASPCTRSDNQPIESSNRINLNEF